MRAPWKLVMLMPPRLNLVNSRVRRYWLVASLAAEERSRTKRAVLPLQVLLDIAGSAALPKTPTGWTSVGTSCVTVKPEAAGGMLAGLRGLEKAAISWPSLKPSLSVSELSG